MKLYAVSDGPPSLAVRMTLKALNLQHEHIAVDYMNGDHMTEDYAKMNPQKEIPVLEDDGFYLSESNAIIQYLCDKYASDNIIYPKDATKRAVVNHRLCFNSAYLYPPISAYVMAPIFFDYERTPAGLKKLHIALDVFDTYLSRHGTLFAAANHMTIADFPLITSIMCLEAIDFKFDQYSSIQKWYTEFKKQYADLWTIAETGMKEITEFEQNPPDLTNLDHPVHPIRKVKH